MAPTRTLSAILSAFALTLVSVPSYAQAPDDATRLSARTLGEEGNELFKKNDFAGALDRYQRAAKLVSVPALHVRIARCLVKLGRLVEASEQYLKASRMPLPADNTEIHKKAQDEAVVERDAFISKIPSIVVIVEPKGAEASVTIDGQKIDPALFGARRLVDPGKHVVEGKLGDQTKNEIIESREGAVESVTLKFEAIVGPKPGGPVLPPKLPVTTPPDAPPSSGSSGQLIAGITLIGVGGASLIMGAVTGGLAVGQKSDLVADGCIDGDEGLQCPPAVFDDGAGGYNTLRIVSAVGLYAGLGIAATGVIVTLTAPSSDDAAPAAALVIGPGRVGVQGVF